MKSSLRAMLVACLILIGMSVEAKNPPASTKLRPYLQFPGIQPKLPPIPRGPQAKAISISGGPWTTDALCTAYGVQSFANGAGLPGGAVIGIMELDGGWVQQDLDAFSLAFGMPRIEVQNIELGNQNLPGVDINSDIEVTLDIQIAAASYYFATGKMPVIKVFFAPNEFGAMTTVIDAAAAANCDVLSISWGAPEDSWEFYAPGMLAQTNSSAVNAATKGMAIFASSGDYSSSDGDVPPTPRVDGPASCPAIVGCGGTQKTISTEVVWGNGDPSALGTGGGYSTVFPWQVYQFGAPRPPKGLGRMVPDISANADPNTGYVIAWGTLLFGGPELLVVGGTSCVSPFYSGITAASGKKLGSINPMLWKSKSAFSDITQGSNGEYKASRGPDACTGLGVLKGAAYTNLFSSTGQTFTISVKDAISGNYNATLDFNGAGPGQYTVTRIGTSPSVGTGKYIQFPGNAVISTINGKSANGSSLFFGSYSAVIVNWKASGIPIIFDNTPATIRGSGWGWNKANKLEFYSFTGQN